MSSAASDTAAEEGGEGEEEKELVPVEDAEEERKKMRRRQIETVQLRVPELIGLWLRKECSEIRTLCTPKTKIVGDRVVMMSVELTRLAKIFKDMDSSYQRCYELIHFLNSFYIQLCRKITQRNGLVFVRQQNLVIYAVFQPSEQQQQSEDGDDDATVDQLKNIKEAVLSAVQCAQEIRSSLESISCGHDSATVVVSLAIGELSITLIGNHNHSDSDSSYSSISISAKDTDDHDQSEELLMRPQVWYFLGGSVMKRMQELMYIRDYGCNDIGVSSEFIRFCSEHLSDRLTLECSPWVRSKEATADSDGDGETVRDSYITDITWLRRQRLSRLVISGTMLSYGVISQLVPKQWWDVGTRLHPFSGSVGIVSDRVTTLFVIFSDFKWETDISLSDQCVSLVSSMVRRYGGSVAHCFAEHDSIALVCTFGGFFVGDWFVPSKSAYLMNEHPGFDYKAGINEHSEYRAVLAGMAIDEGLRKLSDELDDHSASAAAEDAPSASASAVSPSSTATVTTKKKSDQSLKYSLGINTGRVITAACGPTGRKNMVFFGSAIMIAARLATDANRHAPKYGNQRLVVHQSTKKAIDSDVFPFYPISLSFPQTFESVLKGYSEPVVSYQVDRTSGDTIGYKYPTMTEIAAKSLKMSSIMSRFFKSDWVKILELMGKKQVVFVDTKSVDFHGFQMVRVVPPSIKCVYLTASIDVGSCDLRKELLEDHLGMIMDSVGSSVKSGDEDEKTTTEDDKSSEIITSVPKFHALDEAILNVLNQEESASGAGTTSTIPKFKKLCIMIDQCHWLSQKNIAFWECFIQQCSENESLKSMVSFVMFGVEKVFRSNLSMIIDESQRRSSSLSLLLSCVTNLTDWSLDIIRDNLKYFRSHLMTTESSSSSKTTNELDIEGMASYVYRKSGGSPFPSIIALSHSDLIEYANGSNHQMFLPRQIHAHYMTVWSSLSLIEQSALRVCAVLTCIPSSSNLSFQLSHFSDITSTWLHGLVDHLIDRLCTFRGLIELVEKKEENDEHNGYQSEGVTHIGDEERVEEAEEREEEVKDPTSELSKANEVYRFRSEFLRDTVLSTMTDKEEKKRFWNAAGLRDSLMTLPMVDPVWMVGKRRQHSAALEARILAATTADARSRKRPTKKKFPFFSKS